MQLRSLGCVTGQSRVPNNMQERCRELGLFCWRSDPDACIVDHPHEDGLMGAWLRSPGLQPYLVRAVRGWFDAESLEAVELFPGCWLLPFAENQAGEVSGGIVFAMALEPSVFETEQFEAICAGAALDPKQSRELLAPVARYGASDLGCLRKILGWSTHDLAQDAQNQRAIEEFSEKLIQSYEETNLLFKMVRYMNCITVPTEMMESICRQMFEIMPFEWLAIVFNDAELVTRDLAGKLIVAGKLPCDDDLLQTKANAVLDRCTPDNWTQLLEPRHSDLAALVGSEVIFDPISHNNRAIGGLLAGNKRGPDPDICSGETQLLDAVADLLGVFHENILRFAEQQNMFMGTLRALTASIDAKDPYTRGHSDRVALLGAKLAQAVGIDAETVERVRIAGLVHDVGKIGVPEAVLCKQGRLTTDEFDKMKQHPAIGYRILKDIPLMEDILPGVLHHHERWDGGGYPEGLRGEEIPLFGRLIALADAYDAMSSNRSYRPALPKGSVFEEIRRCTGTQFDPALASVFVTLNLDDYEELMSQHFAADRANP